MLAHDNIFSRLIPSLSFPLSLSSPLQGAFCYFLASYAIKVCLELHRGQLQRVRVS